MCNADETSNTTFWDDVWFVSSPLSQWSSTCHQTSDSWALTTLFSPLFLKNMVDIEKIQTNLVICLLNQIGSSSFYFNVFGLESFVELFFVQFHLLTFDFYIKFSPHFFYCYFYFFLIICLSGIVFQFHPSLFDFILFLCQILSSFFSNLFFLSLFYWICFFNFIHNYFGWLGIWNYFFFQVCSLCCNLVSWFVSRVLKIKTGWLHSFLGLF